MALFERKILLNKLMLSRIEQGTSHRLYMCHGSLADNHILVKQLCEIGPRWLTPFNSCVKLLFASTINAVILSDVLP